MGIWDIFFSSPPALFHFSLPLRLSLLPFFFSRSNPPSYPSPHFAIILPLSHSIPHVTRLFTYSQYPLLFFSKQFLSYASSFSSLSFLSLQTHIQCLHSLLLTCQPPANPCWKCPLTLLCLFIPPSPPSLAPSKQSVLWSVAHNKHLKQSHILRHTHMHTGRQHLAHNCTSSEGRVFVRK